MAVSVAMRKDSELHGRRRGRNWAVLAALVALVVLLFAVTIVKLGSGAMNPTAGESWGTALIEWLSGDGEGAGAGGAPGENAGTAGEARQ
jgi:hypothetical protein